MTQDGPCSRFFTDLNLYPEHPFGIISVMVTNAPGRHYRPGPSLVGLARLFPGNAASHDWSVTRVWLDRQPVPPETPAILLVLSGTPSYREWTS